MAGFFGNTFTSQYGETPSRAWILATAGLSVDEMMRGIEHLRDSGRRFPPTAPEFRALCLTELPEQRRLRLQREYEAERQLYLPMPDSVRRERMAFGLNHIRKCREILAGGAS